MNTAIKSCRYLWRTVEVLLTFPLPIKLTLPFSFTAWSTLHVRFLAYGAGIPPSRKQHKEASSSQLMTLKLSQLYLNCANWRWGDGLV